MHYRRLQGKATQDNRWQSPLKVQTARSTANRLPVDFGSRLVADSSCPLCLLKWLYCSPRRTFFSERDRLDIIQHASDAWRRKGSLGETLHRASRKQRQTEDFKVIK